MTRIYIGLGFILTGILGLLWFLKAVKKGMYNDNPMPKIKGVGAFVGFILLGLFSLILGLVE